MIVASQSFSKADASDLGFEAGIAVLALSLMSLYHALKRDKAVLALLAVVSALIGAWTIAADALPTDSGFFSDSTQRWFTFASGAGIVGVALIALCIHELISERLLHALEVEGTERPPSETA
jgi:hypothetical protein